jgi:hypothetical protein
MIQIRWLGPATVNRTSTFEPSHITHTLSGVAHYSHKVTLQVEPFAICIDYNISTYSVAYSLPACCDVFVGGALAGWAQGA